LRPFPVRTTAISTIGGRGDRMQIRLGLICFANYCVVNGARVRQPPLPPQQLCKFLADRSGGKRTLQAFGRFINPKRPANQTSVVYGLRSGIKTTNIRTVITVNNNPLSTIYFSLCPPSRHPTWTWKFQSSSSQWRCFSSYLTVSTYHFGLNNNPV